MQKSTKRWTALGAVAAALTSAGLITAAVLPAQATSGSDPAAGATQQVEDGTADGETADDGQVGEVEDGTADGETDDDAVEVEDGTDDGETADDGQVGEVEDGTADGETADDVAAG